MASNFSYKNTAKTQDQYTQDALKMIGSLYDLAIKQIQDAGKTQEYQSNDAAAARGFGQSGLALDQLNKIRSATTNSVAEQLANKNSEAAKLGYQMFTDARNYDLQNRSQLYNEWNDNRNYLYQKSVDDRNFNYQKGRDKVADNQWLQQFNYQKGRDKVSDSQWNKQFNYQVGRDKVADSQWNKQFDYQKGRDKVSDSQWSQEFALKKKAGSSSGSSSSSRRRSSSSGSSSRSSSYASAPKSKTSSNPINQVPQWFIDNYNNAKKNNVTIGLGTLPGTLGYAKKMKDLFY